MFVSDLLERAVALLSDTKSRRFLLYSTLFLGLIAFSCYVEEWIMKVLPDFNYPWSLAFVELLLFSVWAVSHRWWQEGPSEVLTRRAPMSIYFVFAVSLALSQALGKVTYLYMNYATGTIVKSVRLVPTLLLSVLWLKRPVKASEWIAAVLLTLSSALMALGERLVDVAFNPFGLVVAVVQLFCAAAMGNIQERILKDYDASVSEALLFGNGFGTVIIFAVMVQSDEISTAVTYFGNDPFRFILLIIRSITFLGGAVASNVITKEFGTGATTAVGTARKSLTLLLSFMLFPKPFHINYVFGVVAFVSADLIYLYMGGERAKQRTQGLETQHEKSYELAKASDDEDGDSLVPPATKLGKLDASV